MKIQVLVAAMIAFAALAAPADAATKKHKKAIHRANIGAVHAPGRPQSHDVYVNGELIGRDPDPNIRAFMMRNPHIWDGPE